MKVPTLMTLPRNLRRRRVVPTNEATMNKDFDTAEGNTDDAAERLPGSWRQKFLAFNLVLFIIGATAVLFFPTSVNQSSNQQGVVNLLGQSTTSSNLEQHEPYGRECYAKHYIMLQQQLSRFQTESGLSENQVKDAILHASHAIQQNQWNSLVSLPWIPPMDTIIAGECAQQKGTRSLLHEAVSTSNERLSHFCAMHASSEMVEKESDNLLMVASSRGHHSTFEKLLERGADPCLQTTTDGVAFLPVSFPFGAVSWLKLVAAPSSACRPTRTVLQQWLVGHAREGTFRYTTENLSERSFEDAIRMGQDLVRASSIDDLALEQDRTLGRLYGCDKSDVLFVIPDAVAHPSLLQPQPGKMRPLDAALAGGCGSVLQLFNLTEELKFPCPKTLDFLERKKFDCENSVNMGFPAFTNKANKHFPPSGFKCEGHRHIYALDMLVLREAQRTYGWMFRPHQELDSAMVQIMQSIERPETELLAVRDIFASVSCVHNLPNATLFLLRTVSTDALFGDLSQTWADQEFSDATTKSSSVFVSPELTVQCLLKNHPASPERDSALSLLADVHGATDGPIPHSRKPYVLFLDALRRNMSHAVELFEDVEEQIVASPDEYGGTIVHALFAARHPVENLCLHDETKHQSYYVQDPELKVSYAKTIWNNAIRPLLPQLVNQTIEEEPSIMKNVKTRQCRSTTNERHFCRDEPPLSQCRYLNRNMPGYFGGADVVLETMWLHHHQTLRDFTLSLKTTKRRSPYRHRFKTRALNTTTPLTFAFSNYVGNSFTNCSSLDSMVLEIARAGGRVCAPGNDFAWDLFSDAASSTRNQELVLSILHANPRAFCCSLAKQRPMDKLQVPSGFMISLMARMTSSGDLLSYIVNHYNTLCPGVVPEHLFKFVSKVISASMPRKRETELVSRLGVSTLAALDALDSSSKQAVFSRQCHPEGSSFAARFLQYGFSCSKVFDSISDLDPAFYKEPIDACGETLPPFWVAIRMDLEGYGILTNPKRWGRSLPLLTNLHSGCFWGGEGSHAKRLMDISGPNPFREEDIAIWAASRGFVDVLNSLEEDSWTINVARTAVRERQLDVLASFPETKLHWFYDHNIVEALAEFPSSRVSRMFFVPMNNSKLEATDAEWVRRHEVLEAIATRIGAGDALFPWTRSVIKNLDLFPFYDSGGQNSPAIERIHRREIQSASEILTKLLPSNKTMLSELLFLTAERWNQNIHGEPQSVYDESINLVKSLLEAGADPKVNFDGSDAFVVASEKVALALLDFGARPPNLHDFLCEVAFRGQLDLLTRLLAFGNALAKFPSRKYRGMTPLHCAACNSRVSVPLIDKVLEHGGDRNAVVSFEGRWEASDSLQTVDRATPFDLYSNHGWCAFVFGSFVWNGYSPVDSIKSYLRPG